MKKILLLLLAIPSMAFSQISSRGSTPLVIGISASFNDVAATYGVTASTVAVGTITATGAMYMGAANQVSTITAAGAATFNGAVTSLAGFTGTTLTATGVVSVGTATIKGATYIGDVGMSVSTITNLGVATFNTSVTAPIVQTTSYMGFGPGLTKAAILLLAGGAVGRAYYCTDCTAVTMCVSTGTAVGAWVKVTDRAAACD